MSTRTMNFSTTGEYLQRIMLDLFTSGEFKTFEQMVLDSGMDERHQNLCFRLQFELSGDTKNGGDLNLEVLKESPADFSETLFVAIRTSIGSASDLWNDYDFFDIIERCNSLHKSSYGKTLDNMIILMKYFTPDEIFSICRKPILEHYGYSESENMSYTLHGQRATSGVLCQDGTFIEVPYEQHRYALPILIRLGYVKGQHDVRRSEDDAVHISSSTVSGGLGYQLERGSGEHLSFAQINEIYKNSDIINRFYLTNVVKSGSVGEKCFYAYLDKLDNGGKYGGLQFLKEHYSAELEKYNIKVAEVSHDPESFTDEKLFLRTSPKKSLPGMLNSILIDNNEISVAEGRAKLMLDFEKVKDLRYENKLDYFFQKHIPGANGVAHLDYKKGLETGDFQQLSQDFRYQASMEQGDVVGGKTSNYRLDENNAWNLHHFMKLLVKKFMKKVQIEFVEDENNQLYIVQVRVIDGGNKVNEPSQKDLSGADVLGLTFTESWQNPEDYIVDISDVLIVESEATPADLIGKKLLIVRDNVDFSHILALSSALSIPSIYGLDQKYFDFSEAKRISVNTATQTGIIRILK